MQNSGDEGADERPQIWRFANAVFDESRWELAVDGLVVDIEPRPLELLRCLLRYAGEVVDKRELLNTLYGHSFITEGALSNAVTKLRRALRDTEQTLIATVHRVGYRLTVSARHEDARGSAAAPQTYSQGSAVPGRDNWKLLRALGVHRSAEVWLAEQVKTHDQRVFKFSLDGRGLSALKREVTLFRVLHETLGDREDLVTILDWTLSEPPCYIECAYGGMNLAEWAQTEPQFAAMSLPQRVALIGGIAETVAAAHSAGVLHKDLKPTNVLIYTDSTGKPRTRVTDFGSGRLMLPEQLAKIGITQLGFTQTQGVSSDSGSGTPLYLAPEVLAGESPTSQADVYALGVMLYQAVVGDFRRPLAAGWESDIPDELLREDIRLAANGSPLRRLANADALVQRLSTIEARRAAADDEKRIRFEAQAAEQEVRALRARRRRVLTMSVVLLLATLISTTLYLRARVAEKQIVREAGRTQAVNDFLVEDLLSAINSGDKPVKDLTVKQLLDDALPKLHERFESEPEVEADVRFAIGKSYRQLGSTDEAINEYQTTLALLQGTTDARTARLRLQAGASLMGLLMEDPSISPAIPRMESLLADSRALLGDSDPTVLAFKLELSRADYYQGHWLKASAQIDELLASASGQPADSRLVYRIMQLHAVILNDLARYAEAERACMDILGNLDPNRERDEARIGRVLGLMGAILANEGRSNESLAAFDRAFKLGRRWWPENSGEFLPIQVSKAGALLALGHYAESAALSQHIMAITNDRDRFSLYILGESQLRSGRPEDAEKTFRELLKQDLLYTGNHHPEVARTRLGLTESLFELKRTEEARKVFLEIPLDSLVDLGSSHPLWLRYQQLKKRLED